MARAIRWTIPFKSFNGKDCHIDIYDENYTGSVTTLTGGGTPFYYEEDYNKDILRPVRAKTGYIEVVEETSGALDDLYAKQVLSRYVTVYYGTSVCFIGYIQTRTFDDKWSDGVTVKKFAVSSPLGLLDEVYFPTYSTPETHSLVEMIDIMATQLGITYQVIITPGDAISLIDTMMSTIVVCGINDSHSYKVYNDEPVWEVKPLSFFLENMCQLFGWTAHDVGNTLLFTYPTYMGANCYQYVNTPSGRLRVEIPISGSREIDLSSNFTIADNKAKISSLMPNKSVKYTVSGDNGFTVSWLPHSGSYTYDEATGVYTYHPFCARTSYGVLLPEDDSDTEMRIKDGRKGFTLNIGNYYGFTFGHLNLAMKDIELSDDVPIQIRVTDRAQMDSIPKRYLGLSPALTPYWTTDGNTTINCYISKDSNKLAYELSNNTIVDWRLPMLSKIDLGDIIQIEITFPDLTGTPWGMANGDVILDFKIEYMAYFRDSLLHDDKQLAKYDYSDTGDVDEITPELRNRDSADGLFIQAPSIVPPSPEFLATSQMRLVCNYRANRVLDMSDYIGRIKVLGSSHHWRILAEEFVPSEDTHKLTMHHSNCIELNS